MNQATSLIRSVPEDELSDDLRSLCDQQRAVLGFVPNIIAALSTRPVLLRHWAALMEHLLDGPSSLSEAQRETVAVVVSATNRCHYCQVTHGAALRRLTGDPMLVDQLITNHRDADLDESTRTLVEVAETITASPSTAGEAEVRKLRDLGLSDEDILGFVAIVGLFNMTNRVATTLRWKPNQEYFGLAR
jgi:uncharacterized peroxidase-related enzyme